MDAYIYQAALYCEDCANEIQSDIANRPGSVWMNDDSNTYPQGPYADGGGEADCPQHCDACHMFLENPLTDDGIVYVQEKIAEADARPMYSDYRRIVRPWAEFYADAIGYVLL